VGEVVETLIVEVKGDTSKLRRDMQRSGAVVQQSSQKMQRSTRAASQSFARVGASAARMAAKIGGAVAAFLSFRKVAQAFTEIDSLGKTADRLGITTEALAGLQLAASQTGVPVAALQTSLQFFQRQLGDVITKGTGPATDALDQLGLSAKDLAALPLDKAFGVVADRLNEVGSNAAKTSINIALLGRSGGALANTLALGSKGLDDFKTEAIDLGFAINRVDTAKVEAANDAFDKLGKFITGVGRTIAIELAPALEFITLQLVGAAKESEGFGGVMDLVAKGIVGGFQLGRIAVAAFRVVLNTAIVAFGELGIIATRAAQFAVRGFRLVQAIVSEVSQGAVLATNFVVEVYQSLARDAGNAWEFIKAGAGVASASMVLAFEDASAVVGSVIRTIKAGFATVIDTAATAVAAAEGLKGASSEGSEALANAAGAIRLGIINDGKAAKLGVEQAKGSLVASVAAFEEAGAELLRREKPPGSEALKELAADLDAVGLAQLEAAEKGDALTERLGKNIEVIREFTEEARAATGAAVEDSLALGGADSISAAITQFEALREAREIAFAEQIAAKQEEKRQLAEIEATANEEALARQNNHLLATFSMDNENIQKSRELWDSGLQGRATLLSTFFSNIATLQNSENRKAFEIGKAAAIAEAGVNTFLAATKAYQSLAGIPIVGPGLGAAAAAAAIAAGVANINKIKQTQFGGGASAGASAPAAPGGTAEAGGGGGGGGGGVTQTNQINLSLSGSRFTQNDIRDLIADLNEGLADNNQLVGS
jgi:hypothetical protein